MVSKLRLCKTHDAGGDCSSNSAPTPNSLCRYNILNPRTTHYIPGLSPPVGTAARGPPPPPPPRQASARGCRAPRCRWPPCNAGEHLHCLAALRGCGWRWGERQSGVAARGRGRGRGGRGGARGTGIGIWRFPPPSECVSRGPRPPVRGRGCGPRPPAAPCVGGGGGGMGYVRVIAL